MFMVFLDICCRRWTVEVILVIMRVRKAMLATKRGLTMVMFHILQVVYSVMLQLPEI